MCITTLSDRCAICGLELELSATPASAAETGTCSASCFELLDEQLELAAAARALDAYAATDEGRRSEGTSNPLVARAIDNSPRQLTQPNAR